jgi:hypothetical protein
MLSNCENVSNETMNEKNLIGIYEGNQEKIEFNPDVITSCSVDAYKLDENAVVGGVVWKPVNMDVFSDFYEVSDYGAVRTLHNDKGQYHRRMSFVVDKYGYYRTILHGNGKRITPPIHRLVALAFIPNPNNYDQIDHIDTNKFNNNVCNLRWCTCKENINNPITLKHRNEVREEFKKTDAYKKSRKVGSKKAAIVKGYHVVCLETGKWYNSAMDAAKDVGICKGNVLTSCKRYEQKIPQLLKEYRGRIVYHFRYATEEENAVNVPIYREALLKSLEE